MRNKSFTRRRFDITDDEKIEKKKMSKISFLHLGWIWQMTALKAHLTVC
jgi:hypothetical protein